MRPKLNPSGVTAVSAETALALYRTMRRIRRVEEAIVERYPEQRMRCPVHLCIGQEAVAAGVCQALEGDDQIVSGHRSHGHYLAKGGDLKAMMAEIYGKATGCSGGKGGSMHLIDRAAGFLGATPIVGGTIAMAVGVALAAKLRGETRISVAFFGDAAVETGIFHESLNFAATHRLAVLLVCENNLYSVYSPLSVRQPEGRPIVALARGHGITADALDGNDAEAVHVAVRDAIESLRAGDGPVFLEFATYRWREHCGPNLDNDIGYRAPEEFEAWLPRCPIATHRARLLNDHAVDEDALGRMDADIDKEVRDAFAFAEESAFPPVEEMSTEVYASQSR